MRWLFKDEYNMTLFRPKIDDFKNASYFKRKKHIYSKSSLTIPQSRNIKWSALKEPTTHIHEDIVIHRQYIQYSEESYEAEHVSAW